MGVLLGLAACRISLGDDLKYSCANHDDCGGDGFVCALGPTTGTCCRPSGAEVCDGLDNDCNGTVDDTGKVELCNGEDDDCDGVVDDGFNLQSDPTRCGSCNHICPPDDICLKGVCAKPPETICFDGVDNDGNGQTDCDDPTCERRECAAACLCLGLKKAETLCSEGADNDGDQLVDCADPDCLDKACGKGCACAPDAGRIESDCTDGVDNEGDSKADCLDPDCVGKLCTPPEMYFTCNANKQCKCNDGVQVAEVGSVLCRDGVDNDCNGKKDCGEATCVGQSCAADGGSACECASLQKKELDCANLEDDDGDAKVDCADSDCPVGRACTRSSGAAGSCTAAKTCE